MCRNEDKFILKRTKYLVREGDNSYVLSERLALLLDPPSSELLPSLNMP